MPRLGSRLHICVIGLGYVGLPTAAMFAAAGHMVTGVDINPAVIAELRSGSITRTEPGLVELVVAAIQDGRLTADGAPCPADAFIIAVPTPITPDHRADLTAVWAAAASIAPVLQPGNLVVLESTSPPGTTRSLVQLLTRPDLDAERDLAIAYSPERVLPGRALHELVANDRVIGGLTPEAAARAAALFRSFVQGQIIETDAATAEVVKLMENSYRDVTIALANEFARIAAAVGVDGREAIAIANRHPRVAIPLPGPGVGGHCIPVDPWFLVEAAPEATTLLRAARAVNDGQPDRVVAEIERLLDGRQHRDVALLGMAYKPGVDDLRESPSLEVRRLLIERRYSVRTHDPFCRTMPDGATVSNDLRATLAGAGIAVLLTDHADYAKLSAEYLRQAGFAGDVMLDTRGALDARLWADGGPHLRRFEDQSPVEPGRTGVSE